jgi:methyl-accepting chemotaxis protein
MQCEEIENTTISIVQLAQKLYDIMNHIGAVGTISRQTKEICNSADELVQCLNRKTSESVLVIELLKDKSAALNKSSDEIISIMSVVKEINEKINILSMNAARAGTAGNGFAVVASEIRKLADQTKNSTKYIDEIVFKVQSDANDSIKLIDSTDMIILEQEAMVKDTQSAFHNIVKHMEDIVYQVDNMNTSIVGINEYKDSATVSISSIAGSSLNNESQINGLMEEIEENKVNAIQLVDLANHSIVLFNEIEHSSLKKEEFNG